MGKDVTSKQSTQTSLSQDTLQSQSREVSVCQAKAHWKYVESVLMAHRIPLYEIDICGLHYKTAFEHGYGHGAEDQATGRIKFEPKH
jgi:hypothetical protein